MNLLDKIEALLNNAGSGAKSAVAHLAENNPPIEPGADGLAEHIKNAAYKQGDYMQNDPTGYALGFAGGSMDMGEKAAQGLSGTLGKSEAYQRFMDRVGKRIASEAHGQAILDDLVENGISVKDVEGQFWDNVYDKLPANIQEKFHKYIRSLSGSSGPGSTIGLKVMPDGSRVPIVAKHWRELLDLGHDPEYLEGSERGLVALMAHANANASKLPSAATELGSNATSIGPGITQNLLENK